MPELPEVEVVRLGLVDHVVGRRVDAVTVHDPRSLRRHELGPRDFTERLTGQTFASARRRGKYLWLPLVNGDAVVAHLGMSGQMLIGTAAAPRQRHLRVTLDLSDHRQVRFVDQRIFGGMWLSTDGAALPAEIAHIARDPLDPDFDIAELFARLRRRETGLKRALLDQGLISGVGNIYADEALWRARLHYARNTRFLRRGEVARLVQHAVDVMTEALAQGGTSFDSLYVNVDGDSGYFERSLHVYGREDQPCPRCATLIRRTPFMNRSSYWCPACQPRPRNGRW